MRLKPEVEERLRKISKELGVPMDWTLHASEEPIRALGHAAPVAVILNWRLEVSIPLTEKDLILEP